MNRTEEVSRQPTNSRQGGNGPRRQFRDINGILLLDKPTGLTSNHALQKVKRLYQAKKAGHTGSLDPLASGMLPLCFGQATKVSTYLLDADKVYEVTAHIGQRTDTADADGVVTATALLQKVTREQLDEALTAHRGDIMQIPPMYSALKKDGRRLYELAREGKEVERPPRPVTIYELEVIEFDPQFPRMRVRCSKGTYIRTLVETIAEGMGTLAHVATLRRISVEPFAQEAMITAEQLEALAEDPQALEDLLLPADAALQAYPVVQLGASESFYLRNGHTVTAGREVPAGAYVRLYDENERFLGIGEALGDGTVAPRRLFADPVKPVA